MVFYDSPLWHTVLINKYIKRDGYAKKQCLCSGVRCLPNKRNIKSHEQSSADEETTSHAPHGASRIPETFRGALRSLITNTGVMSKVSAHQMMQSISLSLQNHLHVHVGKTCLTGFPSVFAGA